LQNRQIYARERTKEMRNTFTKIRGKNASQHLEVALGTLASPTS
jgi:hypothetical protein